MTEKTFDIISSKGLNLVGHCWIPDEFQSVICIVHGHGEHISRYDHVARFFGERGFAVYGFDHRGHGKSPGKRGHAPDFSALLNDVENLLSYVRREHNDLPMVLYGHSMGGNISLNYLLRNKSKEITCAVISSPWIRLAFEPPRSKVRLAKMMINIFPSFTEDTGLDVEQISRDTEEVEKYRNDPLVHSRMSAALFFALYNSGLEILDGNEELTTPVLLIHGTGDGLTSHKASEEFAASHTLADLHLWEDSRHELHNEINKNEVLNFVGKWLQNKLEMTVTNLDSSQ